MVDETVNNCGEWILAISNKNKFHISIPKRAVQALMTVRRQLGGSHVDVCFRQLTGATKRFEQTGTAKARLNISAVILLIYLSTQHKPQLKRPHENNLRIREINAT